LYGFFEADSGSASEERPIEVETGSMAAECLPPGAEVQGHRVDECPIAVENAGVEVSRLPVQAEQLSHFALDELTFGPFSGLPSVYQRRKIMSQEKPIFAWRGERYPPGWSQPRIRMSRTAGNRDP
jgi:hypothetical protein